MSPTPRGSGGPAGRGGDRAADQAVGDPALGILHVDLDAFYASVEQLADPRLRGRPVVVGGLGARGVVAAASYEARRFGVHSAMPMVQARRACPEGAFLAPRFDRYRAASRQVMAILESFTPVVEPLSLDEAFLDVRSVRRLHGTAPEIASSIRVRVQTETGLCASVGVATTKLLAKIASARSKPDGLLVIEAAEERAFLRALPVEDLWGVGEATRRRLAGFGIRTVGDLAAAPETTLTRAFGRANGARLRAMADNRDDREVQPGREAKSIGREQTFAADVTDPEALERTAIELADSVASRLRRAGLVTRTVVLKVRAADFHTITRSRTLPGPSDLAADVARVALDLLGGVDVGVGIRLLGVTARQLAPGGARQGALPLDFGGSTQVPPDEAGPRRAVQAAVDRARERFGDRAVFSARLTPPVAPTRDGPAGRQPGDPPGDPR